MQYSNFIVTCLKFWIFINFDKLSSVDNFHFLLAAFRVKIFILVMFLTIQCRMTELRDGCYENNSDSVGNQSNE